jgi:hypothetical protein
MVHILTMVCLRDLHQPCLFGLDPCGKCVQVMHLSINANDFRIMQETDLILTSRILSSMELDGDFVDICLGQATDP